MSKKRQYTLILMLGVCFQFLELHLDYSNTNKIMLCSSLVYDSAEPQRQKVKSIVFHIFHNLLVKSEYHYYLD